MSGKAVLGATVETGGELGPHALSTANAQRQPLVAVRHRPASDAVCPGHRFASAGSVARRPSKVPVDAVDFRRRVNRVAVCACRVECPLSYT